MKSVFYVIYVQHIFSSYIYSIIKLRITYTTLCDNIHMIMIFHHKQLNIKITVISMTLH